MNSTIDVFRNLHDAVSSVWHLLGYALNFLWLLLQPKAVLAGKILALQSQLAACKDRIDRKKAPRPRFTEAFRILWVILSKVLSGWERLAAVMRF